MKSARTCYKVYLEEKGNQTTLLDIIDNFLDYYTLYSGCCGCFRGMRETATVIEYIGRGDITTGLKIQQLAKHLKNFYGQTTVTIITFPCFYEDV